MASFEIVFKSSVRRDFRGIPPEDAKRILSVIDDLAHTPVPPAARKLAGHEVWRIRIGRYRVLYEIARDEVIITIIKVGHRRHVYRGLS